MKKVLLVVLLLSVVARLEATPKVKHLRCEHLDNPLAVNTLWPRLSWQIDDCKQQSAYSIEVASDSLMLVRGKADLWKSGRVQSDRQVLVDYAGKALAERRQCYWRVKVWDENRRESKWSQVARFGIGIIDGNTMHGKYIAMDGADGSDVRSPLLFSTFKIETKEQGRVMCHVNSLGYHEVYVNGHKVGDAVLAPAVSQLGKRSLIVTYDITDYAVKGENSIALWLGQGWYKKTTYGAQYDGPVVRAEIDFCTSKGDYKVLASTDETWRGVEGGYYDTGTWMALQFGGEHLDGRIKPTDVTCQALSNRKNRTVTVVQVPKHKVSPQMCENNSIRRESTAVTLTAAGENVWMADMGRVLTGWFEMTLSGMASGDEVKIEYCDNLDKDGNFESQGESDIYVCSGAKEERFCNKFNHHAYRYVRISGLSQAPSAGNLKGLQIYGDYSDDASFECSDSDINAIHDMVKYTMSCLTFGGYMVDCPHLERTGYGGDGNSSTMALQTMYGVAGTYANWLQAWGDAMREGGSLPHVAPNAGAGGGGPYWCGFIVLAPWRTYLNYGDKRLLATYYPYMKEWMKYVECYTVDGLLHRWPDTKYRDWYLGDWLAPMGVDAGNEKSVNLVSNCLVSECLDAMSRIALILGEGAESARWAMKRDALCKRIDEEFYDAEAAVYATGSQLDMTYAMLTGVAQGNRLEQMRKQMLRRTREVYDTRLAGGLVGVPIITQWLIDNHECDLMYKMLKQRTYPGYLYMIDHHATTTWEYWSGERSRVHNCYNGIGNWFYQAIGGLRIDDREVAYKHFTIDVQMPEGMEWAKMSKNTPYGIVKVAWKRSGELLTYGISVPSGSSATVKVPQGYRTDHFATPEGNIELEAGNYDIIFKKI